MLREALAVYHKLLKDGELDAKRDGELYLEFRKEEVRQTLSQFEEELGFRLLDTGKTIYLVPNQSDSLEHRNGRNRFFYLVDCSSKDRWSNDSFKNLSIFIQKNYACGVSGYFNRQ